MLVPRAVRWSPGAFIPLKFSRTKIKIFEIFKKKSKFWKFSKKWKFPKKMKILTFSKNLKISKCWTFFGFLDFRYFFLQKKSSKKKFSKKKLIFFDECFFDINVYVSTIPEEHLEHFSNTPTMQNQLLFWHTTSVSLINSWGPEPLLQGDEKTIRPPAWGATLQIRLG